MKARLITAAIGVAILLLVFILLPKIGIAVFVALLSLMAVYELTTSTKLLKNSRMVLYSIAFAAFIPIWSYFDNNGTAGAIGVFVYILLMFGENLIAHKDMDCRDTEAAVGLSFMVPFMLSSIVRLSLLKCGRSYALLPLVIAFLSDTGAMLGGMLFGKHKLTPELSPKKTVEGAISGVVLSVIATVVYGVIVKAACGHGVNFVVLVITALLGSALSQIGDLTFSLIKRHSGIKDYSSVLKGHGGIMDRFDSVCFAAPFVELMVTIAAVFTTTSLI